MGMGWLYTHIIEPTYEVSSTMLVDIYKRSSLPESRTIKGHIRPLHGKKNIYNELGVIKSYELVESTLKAMKANVTYHTNNIYLHREQFGYFPFQISLVDTSQQLIDLPFKVDFLSDSTYVLMLKADTYKVLNPQTQKYREVEQEFSYQDTFAVGEEVKNDYFHFTLNQPDYEIIGDEFEGFDLSFQIHSYRDLAAQYIDVLTIHLYDIESSIVHITTRGPVLPKEKEFHNQLAKEYIAYLARSRARAASGRKAFIKDQMQIYKDSLDQAEQELERYMQTFNAIDLAHTSNSALTQYQNLETEKNQLHLNIRYYYSVLKYLSDDDGLNQVIAPSIVGIKDPLLNQSLVDLKKLGAERSRLEYTKGEESLDLQSVNEQIANIKTILEENLRSLVENARLALSQKQNQIIELDTTINNLPSKEKAFVNFKRKTNLYGNLYNYLSKELEKSGIAGAENMNDTQVLDTPRMMHDGPFWPQRFLIRIITFLMGLVLPIILVMIIESLNDVIKTVKEVETYSEIPIIGRIARFQTKPKLLSKGKYQWHVQESFRDLCAGLQFNIVNPKHKVIGMLSTIPGEGKTFCSINLAVNLASSGKRTLLIDVDFRKPGITDDVDKIKGRGLSNYLKGDLDSVNEVIHLHKDQPSLHYIPTLVEETNPQELLSSPRLPLLIEELRDQYDYIIFDSPAIGVVSDYLMIAPYMDIHLYVLRCKLSRFTFIKDLQKRRRTGSMENMYFVVNDVSAKSKYGYTYQPKGDPPSVTMVRKYLLS